MFPLSPSMWGAVAVAVLVAALGIAVKVQTSRLDSVRKEYAAFVAQVYVQGKAAEQAAKTKELSYLKAKEQADAKSKKLLADNADLGKRLRNARASSGYVPQPPADSPSPDRACFDRAQLERAIGNLDAGLQSIVGQGDEAKLRLSTAAEWARSVGAQ